MSHGDIEGNWYQKQMKGLSLLVVKTFPEMRRAGRLLRESFFSSFSSVLPFKWSACVWQSWEGLLRLYDESLLVFGSNENFSSSFLLFHRNPSALSSHLFTSALFLSIFCVDFWLEGGLEANGNTVPFQVMQQRFENCCQSNPTLCRTKETSHYFLLFLISIAICGNV